MTHAARIERALEAAVTGASGPDCPPQLAQAMAHAVFPGGARVRPNICLAVAAACGDDAPDLADAAAAAVELMHCASLVHDDLPCFDDAATRRGRPSTHAVHGVPIALLSGDALIVLAFQTLAKAGARRPDRLAVLVSALARGVGAPGGIVAGQAWESEPVAPVDVYHRAKTGALFVTATTLGALAAGGEPGRWALVGDRLGAAYQIADDLMDACACGEEAGKPCGQDVIHQRPSAVKALGVDGAVVRLQSLIGEAVAAIPPCPGASALAETVKAQARRLVPSQLATSAA